MGKSLSILHKSINNLAKNTVRLPFKCSMSIKLFVFNQEGCIKLIKRDSKDFYDVTKKIIFQVNAVLFPVHQTILKRNMVSTKKVIYIKLNITVFFNCLLTFSKLCLFFFQTLHTNPRISHTKCKMPHISCKMKHCFQNITNTSQKQTFANTFVIILIPVRFLCVT